jgi:hypothetical protein
MKHSIQELYRDKASGALVTRELAALDPSQYRKALSKQHATPEVKVYGVDGWRLIYMFGEKTWFDRREEYEAYSAEYHAQRELNTERNKAKAQLMQYIDEHMSTEEIISLLHRLGG